VFAYDVIFIDLLTVQQLFALKQSGGNSTKRDNHEQTG